MFDVNWIAVIVAALSGFLIGGLWYGPIFGKSWQVESGVSDEMAQAGNMPMIFGLTFLLNLFSAFVLAPVLMTYATPALGTTIMIAGGIALGFIIPAIGINYLFRRKSLKLFMIDAIYWLVAYSIMGLIFTLFS